MPSNRIAALACCSPMIGHLHAALHGKLPIVPISQRIISNTRSPLKGRIPVPPFLFHSESPFASRQCSSTGFASTEFRPGQTRPNVQLRKWSRSSRAPETRPWLALVVNATQLHPGHSKNTEAQRLVMNHFFCVFGGSSSVDGHCRIGLCPHAREAPFF